MAFGISQSVRSREVQVCTPELFHQATKSSRVKDVCAQIEDALERKRRGEIGQEDYDTMKTRLKSQLPILTPHATFRNGRRLNADAIPSGLSIYDKDHIADPTGWWKAKSEELRVKNPQVLARILLVHVTPSLEGLRLVFVMPEGMNLAEAQKWMSQQLGDEEYDVCVKDLARPSFIVPEEYILFIDEARLFAPLRSSSGMDERGSNGDAASQANTHENTNHNTNENENKTEKEHRPESDNSSAALSAGTAVEHAQSANHDCADDHHIGNHGVDQDHGGEERRQDFAQEYDGISYEAITSKLVELLGGEPQHGSRNSFIFTLSCYLRYLCDDNATWIKQVIPTFGEEKKRAFTTVDSACQRKQSHRMPMIVRKAISLCQEERARGKAADYDADDFGDILNPDSYFYRIHEMPQKLPRLIRLLVSKTPAIYQPAVSQAVFPALASHLCDTRFRYVDNVEHEATLMNILCAPTGSGKESITQPINRIMADIRARDAQQRERERAWKDECNRKGSNKDKRERPEGLVIRR